MIALIENGDEIEMDIAGGTVNLLVSDEVLAERRKSWVRPPLKQQKGVLNIYAQNCRPAEEGGAMQPWALDAISISISSPFSISAITPPSYTSGET